MFKLFKDRKFLMTCCAGLSFIFLFSGSVIYAMPETSVTNHFGTGIVDIELDEYELTADGQEQPFRDYTGEEGMNPLILPGTDISKIPRITNEGNDCYVRAKLTFRDIDVELEDDLYGFPEGWTKHADGYYYYDQILETGDEIDIFKGLLIPIDFPQSEECKTFYLDIDVDSIQSKNFTPDFESDSPWGPVEIQDCIKEDMYDITTFKSVDDQTLTVIYQGDSKELFSNPDDFFINFPVFLPGDEFSDEAELKNNSKTPIKLYFRSEVTHDSDLLEKLNLTITSEINGKVVHIYDGPMKNSIIEDNLLLGTIPAGAWGTLKFTVTVPPELDNYYTILNSYVKWIFSTEPIETVKTGDNGNVGLMFISAGIVFAMAAFLLREKEEKKKRRVRARKSRARK